MKKTLMLITLIMLALLSGCGTIHNNNIHLQDFKYKNGSSIGQGIGYISVPQIDEASYKTIEESLKKLKADNMKALILDLRMIGGRDKDSAIKACDLFLNEGDSICILQTRRNNKSQKSLIKTKSAMLSNVPMVVLIDMGTSAGAELIAMALKNNKRATFVGLYTSGDSVLEVMDIPFEDKKNVKLATSSFASPASGDFGGVLPDIEVKIPPEEQKEIAFCRFHHRMPTEQIKDQQLKAAIDFLQKGASK